MKGEKQRDGRSSKNFSNSCHGILVHYYYRRKQTQILKAKRVLCNLATYKSDDPFATSLAYILEEMKNAAPDRENYDLYKYFTLP